MSHLHWWPPLGTHPPSVWRPIRRVLPRIVLTIILVTALGVSSHAQTPILWTGPDGNGHYYEFGKGIGLTWYDADRVARSKSFHGMAGHLVTVNTRQEQQFLVERVQRGYPHLWYGAYQDLNALDYKEPGGGWRWVTGEPWLFTNWGAGEPNNYNNGPGFDQEDGLVYINHPVLQGWMDAPRNYNLYWPVGFVVEYEPIPEPGTLMLLWGACLGALGLAPGQAYRRKRWS